MTPRPNRYRVRSAIAEQGAPTLAYAQALAAQMFILQGTGHAHKPVRISGPTGPLGTFTPQTGFVYHAAMPQEAVA